MVLANQAAGDGDDPVCLAPKIVRLQRIQRSPLYFRNVRSRNGFAFGPARGEIQNRVMKPDAAVIVAAAMPTQ